MRITRGYRKMQIFADADILHRFYPITDEKGGGHGAITFHLIWPPVPRLVGGPSSCKQASLSSFWHKREVAEAQNRRRMSRRGCFS